MLNDNLRLIRNRNLEQDSWLLHESLELPKDDDNWIVKLETWRINSLQLSSRNFPLGVLIATDTNLTDPFFEFGSNGEVEKIAFIAINFPTYTDGRGFSLAQILRNEFGWTGELRAVGDVLIDTIHYLARCGFDSFLVKEGHDASSAMKALETFTVHYQKSYPKPL